MPSLSPSRGQASAARYWYNRKQRDRPEKLVAEPCTARTWWIVIEPALPRHGTARQVDVALFRIHRAAEPSVRAVVVVDRPLVATRHDHHRTVLHVDIVDHNAERRDPRWCAGRTPNPGATRSARHSRPTSC